MTAHYQRLMRHCRVPSRGRFQLRDFAPDSTLASALPVVPASRGATAKDRALAVLADSRARLEKSQELLWASDTYSVLVVLQGMDAAGKDGTVKHVMQGLNPQACEVHQFRRPEAEDLDHGFLWRAWQRLPARGRIGIFNRSYYEDVVVPRVHPELLAAQRLPPELRGRGIWVDRIDDINAFERHLVRNGTIVLKFFLHLSRAEQQRRLVERIDDPRKRWKFSPADVEERKYWSAYARVYEQTIAATNTAWAPWHIVPADHKFVTRAAVASILSGRIDALRLRYPEVSAVQARNLARARRQLMGRSPRR